MTGQTMQALAELGIPIISDEIYHGLTYEGEEHSILEFTDNAFVFGGFSKAYAMTGWRLGYLIAPLECMRTLQTLHQNFLSAPITLFNAPPLPLCDSAMMTWSKCGLFTINVAWSWSSACRR